MLFLKCIAIIATIKIISPQELIPIVWLNIELRGGGGNSRPFTAF